MNIRNIKRETKQRVVVVLEGNKASEESTGVAPLCKAIHDVVGPEDQVLVLTLLYWNSNINDAAVPAAALSSPLVPVSSSHDHERFFGGDDDDQMILHDINPDIKFLYGQEIGQRTKAYAQVFKPFYLTCHTYGVSTCPNYLLSMLSLVQ